MGALASGGGRRLIGVCFERWNGRAADQMETGVRADQDESIEGAGTSPGAAGARGEDSSLRPGSDLGAGEGFGEFRALDPRFLVTERIASSIFSGVVLLGALVALLLDAALGWWEWPWRGLAWLVFLGLAALLAWASLVWPRMAHRAVRYRYGAAGIEVRRGVWWRRVLTVPVARIQHTDVTQGPLLRRFGLAMLTMHTAATRTPSITLSGLALEEAVAVRDALQRASGGEGV